MRAVSSFTLYFAQLAGLYFVILGVILVVRKRAIIELMSRMAEDQPLVFLAGMIRLIVGLAVLVGNGAGGGSALQVVVALIGWIALIRGVAMLLVTQTQQRKLIEFWQRDMSYYTASVITVVLGIYLARAGFSS